MIENDLNKGRLFLEFWKRRISKTPIVLEDANLHQLVKSICALQVSKLNIQFEVDENGDEISYIDIPYLGIGSYGIRHNPEDKTYESFLFDKNTWVESSLSNISKDERRIVTLAVFGLQPKNSQ